MEPKKMEVSNNNRSGVDLQRRSSLPPRLQRHATLSKRCLQRRRSSLRSRPVVVASTPACNRLNKSNPYVGSFRHAPSTNTTTTHHHHRAASCSSVLMERLRFNNSNFLTTTTTSSLLHEKVSKSSPYIGWFRHAPPSRLDNFMTTTELSLLLLESTSNTKWTVTKRGRHHVWVSGHLKGGAPEFRPAFHRQNNNNNNNNNTNVYSSLHESLKHSSKVSPSGTIKVFSRMASWLLSSLAHHDSDDDDCSNSTNKKDLTDVTELFPHLYPPLKTIPERDADDDSHASYSSSDCDDDESTVSSNVEYSENVDFTVSSLAEAYYMHQAAKAIDDSTHTNTEEDGHRLDYVITQMDIARMARNASRHLDVASILSLPVITYRAPPAVSREQDEPGFSWMIVPPNPNPDVSMDAEAGDEGAANKHQTTMADEENHVCVICLEQFVEGDRLRLLPCNHSFHVGCIDRWLSGSHSFEDCYTSGCPTCKKRPEIVAPPVAPAPADGSVPPWAFARIGNVLASRDSVTSV